jgi:hypothetical protein
MNPGFYLLLTRQIKIVLLTEELFSPFFSTIGHLQNGPLREKNEAFRAHLRLL